MLLAATCIWTIRAVGETTHLAARMEQLATPGTIRFPPPPLRLVEGLVRVHTLGPVPVKGGQSQWRCSNCWGLMAPAVCLQAAVARGLTRFVGRQQELAALHQALEQAAAGREEPGGGPGGRQAWASRAWSTNVSTRTAPQGWLVLESAWCPTAKPLLLPGARPAQALLPCGGTRRHPHTCQGHRTDSDAERGAPGHLPGAAGAAGRATGGQPLSEAGSAAAAQRWPRSSGCCCAKVRCSPCCWSSRTCTGSIPRRRPYSTAWSRATSRLLLLVNYRPEYQHGWGSKTYYTQLRLDPLPSASTDEFLQALLGDAPSLASLKQLLIARTEGNPFFLEESVRTLVETEVLVGMPGAYRLAQAVPSIQVPATVQAVMAARIDRLPPEEKRLLQTAAVIGMEVSLPLLQAIAELPEETLHRGQRTSRRPSFCTRRASSRSTSTPSSTP